MIRIGCTTALMAVLSACGTGPQPERVGVARAAVIALEPPTSVQSGTPSLRTPKCPGNRLPDQCGTWAGVELQATRNPASVTADEHCLCESVDFVIPLALPVTQGQSGAAGDKAMLSFRTASGRQVECRYRGNKVPGLPLGGDKYVFERCVDGSKPGQSIRSDWFRLEPGPNLPGLSAIEVSLRLGEPDVVGGVVQEQVYYSSDARIAGAALHVPRGAAPAFEAFSLLVLADVPLGTNIPNDNDSATSISLAVDVRADSAESFTFTKVPGAGCPRIELPYDQATLESLVGPGGESSIQAHQLTTLTDIGSGAQVLTSAGPVTVDLARRTFSFCVEHLSFYLGAVGGFDSDLTLATIRSTGSDTVLVNLLADPALPTLTPLQTYELTLGFTRRGGGSTAWLSNSDIHLVAVGTPSLAPPIVTALSASPTPWGTPVSTAQFAGSPVAINKSATFTLPITAPLTAQPLNLCLRRGPSATSGFFGDCFSWDLETPPPGTTPGTTPVALSELCDGVDSNGNGSTNDGITQDCYSGPVGTQGQGQCRDGVAICSEAGAWGACDGEVTPTSETCNQLDDDCDGSIDEGACSLSWASTGAMSEARTSHTATLLADGKVLVAGGDDVAVGFIFLGAKDSAELYDPALGTFSTIGSMATPRTVHRATRLLDGTVLVSGGISPECSLSESEIYDPALQAFRLTGEMQQRRLEHTATLLSDGRVLIVGGSSNGAFCTTGGGLSSAEIYDPATETFVATGSLAFPRFRHAAVRLPDGRVLVSGGQSQLPNVPLGAEVYDPATGNFSNVGNMSRARQRHSLSVLLDGSVLCAGGLGSVDAGSTVEPFDPLTLTFLAPLALAQAHSEHQDILLADGRLLLIGGSTAGVSLLDPSTDVWSTAEAMSVRRERFAAVRLLDGRVLATGGAIAGQVVHDSAELLGSSN